MTPAPDAGDVETVIDVTDTATEARRADAETATEQMPEAASGEGAATARWDRVRGGVSKHLQQPSGKLTWADRRRMVLLQNLHPVALSHAGTVLWAWLWATTVAIALLGGISALVILAGPVADPAEVLAVVWRSGYQVGVPSAAGTITLFPMSLWLVLFWSLYRTGAWTWTALRRSGARVAIAGLAVVGTGYLALAIGVISLGSADLAAPDVSLLAPALTVFGGLSVGALSVVLGDQDRMLAMLLVIRRLVLLHLGLGAVLVFTALVTYWPAVAESSQTMLSGSTWLGSLGLLLLQLLYLPNLVVWGAGYASGAGIMVGGPTEISAFNSVEASLPNLPALAAVPDQALSAPILLPLLLLGFGALGGVWLRRRGIGTRLATRLMSSLIVTIGVGTALFILGQLASGALGVNLLAQLGPSPLALAITGALWSGAGLLIWALGPTVVADARRMARESRRETRRESVER